MAGVLIWMGFLVFGFGGALLATEMIGWIPLLVGIGLMALGAREADV